MKRPETEHSEPTVTDADNADLPADILEVGNARGLVSAPAEAKAVYWSARNRNAAGHY